MAKVISHVATLALLSVLTSPARSRVIGVTSQGNDVGTAVAAGQSVAKNIGRDGLAEPAGPRFDKEPMLLIPRCPDNHWYNSETRTCARCSGCLGGNRIVRAPCTGHSDTVCGPFYEFDSFRQASAGNHLKAGADEGVAQEQGDADGLGEKGQHHFFGITGPRQQGDPRDRLLPHALGGAPEADLTSLHLERARSEWRTLSLALMAVLSLLCGVAAIGGVYAYFQCRRARHHKHLIREPEYLRAPLAAADQEPRYVDTYFASARGLRSPRHLPVYQNVYTGTGSHLHTGSQNIYTGTGSHLNAGSQNIYTGTGSHLHAGSHMHAGSHIHTGSYVHVGPHVPTGSLLPSYDSGDLSPLPSPNQEREEGVDGGDQYIYLNLPLVSKTGV